MTLKEWMLNHILENPGITFSSIHRDACRQKMFKYSAYDGSIQKVISDLKSEGMIEEYNIDYNTFFKPGKHLMRDKLIDDLLS